MFGKDFWHNAKEFWYDYKKNRLAIIGLIITASLLIISIGSPIFAPYRPSALSFAPLKPPSWDHPMGTDDLGRDVYSGFLYGARVSLIVGLLAALTSSSIGIAIGAIAGYAGGNVDNLLMRFTEVFMVIPRFVFALIIAVLFGANIWNIIWVIGVLYWPSTARLVRAEFLSLKEYEFVKAARALGISDLKIIFSEILPNAIPPAIVNGSLMVASAILTEAGLSFLGLGDVTLRSWGIMLHDSQAFVRSAWWMAAFPGLGIFLITWGFNSVAEGLNDALNPRLREG